MEDPTNDRFRHWVAARARDRRLSHAQLAMRCGIDRSTVSRLMAGDRQPSLVIAIRILHALEGDDPPGQLARLIQIATGSDVEQAIQGDAALSPGQQLELIGRYQQMRNRFS